MPVQISMNIDEHIKQRFDMICEDVGVTPSVAISMFITNAVIQNNIPFNEGKQLKKPKRMKKPKRTLAEMFGCAEGRFNIPDDFNEPLEDFREYME
jgi:addiction module RelB/DinJ family antitoxin